MLTLIIGFFFISCNGNNSSVSIIGLWVTSNNSTTYNNDNMFLFNPDSTMGDLGHSPGHWMIKGDTITIVHLKQNYYDNFFDTVTYNFNFISSYSLEFYKRDVKETVISDPYSSENKSTILKVVTIDTIRVTRAKKQDIPFDEAIVGEWSIGEYGRKLNIHRDGRIKVNFLKPSDKRRSGISRRWSEEYFITSYNNIARYVINTDSSLTITFDGTTTHHKRSQEYNGGPVYTDVLSRNSAVQTKFLKIKHVFNNYLMTDKGDFQKILFK